METQMVDVDMVFEDDTPNLTAKDRCDQCNQRAYFLAVFDYGELYFCRRCFMKNESSLRKIAYFIHDQSHELEKSA